MNIKELRYYHDLVIQKNFSKVATHFGVAQPTITMAIQRLERELGAPLFIRSQSHHDLTVTASGLQFDQHVQTILRELGRSPRAFPGQTGTNPLWPTADHR